jgi:hypothetical protein
MRITGLFTKLLFWFSNHTECKIGLKVAKNENFADKFSRYQILISVIAYAVPFTPTYRITRMNIEHAFTHPTYLQYKE